MNRHYAARLILAGVLTATAFAAVPSGRAAPKAWKARPASYGISIEKDVRVVMSDGVRLDVDVRRPAGQDGTPARGQFPVIVTQTPYNKNSPQLNFASDYLVQRGYVQVISDVRGTGSSEGSWDSFGPLEQADGKTLVEWAGAQPWSNGSIGLAGASYGAINQLFTAWLQPKGLKAIFPIVPSADTYRDIVASGGQVNTSFIPAWLGLVTGTSLLPPTYVASDPVGAALSMSSHLSNLTGFQARTVYQSLLGGTTAYDGPFYRTRSTIEHIDKVTVPAFVVGGWFDLFQRGEPMIYQALRKQGVPTRLIMGPWTHLQGSQGAGLPVDGVPSLDELRLRWFDHYVIGLKDPGLDKDVPQVRYYDNALRHYQTAISWPPAGVTYTALNLGGVSSLGGTAGTLGRAPGTGSDMLPYIPVTGVCTGSTVQWTAGLASSPCDTDNSYNDRLGVAYDLPVTKPLKLAGTFSARLFVSTTGRDGQVTARVEDVDPTGKATQLTAGWQVLSLRATDKAKSTRFANLITQPWHPFTQASVLPVTAGQVMEVWVEVFGSATTIMPGHKLRLSLQAADFPHLTAPVPQLANTLGSVLTIVHDAAHPSQLIIPTA